MRDAFISYPDGRRIAVSDLPTCEVMRLAQKAPILKNTGGSERTADELLERLRIEIVIRQRHMNTLL